MFSDIRLWCLGLFFVLYSSIPVQGQIPIPAAIGGSVTVNGAVLTQAKAEDYRFVVTRHDGSAYDSAAEHSGLNNYDWYRINIPMYDSNLQPGGAKHGDTAIIKVYRKNVELEVISPAGGEFTVGEQGSTTRIDLLVIMDRVRINSIMMLLLGTD